MELHSFSWNFSLTLRHEPYVKGEAVATQPAPFWVWYEDRWQINHWGKSCDITMSLSTYCISTTLQCPCKLGSSGLWFLICERQTVLRRALRPRPQCRKRKTVWNLHASIVIIVLFPLSYKKRCGFPEFSFFEKRKVEAYSTFLFKFIFKCMGWTQKVHSFFFLISPLQRHLLSYVTPNTICLIWDLKLQFLFPHEPRWHHPWLNFFRMAFLRKPNSVLQLC